MSRHLYQLLLIVPFVFVCAELSRTTKFELPSAARDRDEFEKGREKLSEYSTYAESSPCWNRALAELNSTCKTLTEEKQSRLALAFSNCHWERSGRESYPCPPDASFKECTCKEKMGDSAFMVYTQFFTHTGSMCYYLQSQLWQEKTETTVNLMSEASDVVVSKLDQALDYHRILDRKQDESLNNQQTILAQDKKIAESLDETSIKMSKAFQEMQDKAEKHNLMLDDLLGKLVRGMDSVKWLLSLILGEMILLETVWFFALTFLVVSMAPQFGMSRLALYAVIIVYCCMEVMLRRFYLWIRAPDPSNMETLHYLLYWSRWMAIAVLFVVYVHFWWTRDEHKVAVLVQRMHDQMFAGSSRMATPVASPSSAAAYPQHHHRQSGGREELDVGVRHCQTDSSLGFDGRHHESEIVVPLSELGKYFQGKGQYLAGTQMLDHLSGIYIGENSRIFSPDDFSSDSDGSDNTYIPDNDTVAYSTYTSNTDISAMDMMNENFDILQKPLNRTPLPESHSQGNIQLAGYTPLHYQQPIRGVSGAPHPRHCLGAVAIVEECEKEVAVEKNDGDGWHLEQKTPRLRQSRSTRRSVFTKQRASGRTHTTPTSTCKYNLRSRN